MKVRFVVIIAIILMVIGIVISCFDYAKTIPSSNEAEMQEPQTETSKDPEVTETPETTGTTEEPKVTEPPETTGKTEVTKETKEPSISEDNEEQITFKSEYICEDGVMPYALYTPSTINESEKTPLKAQRIHFLWAISFGYLTYIKEIKFYNWKQ